MELGVGMDMFRLVGEGQTAPADEFGQRGQVGAVAIGQRLVDERPESFGRLQFGTVGRQELQRQAGGDHQILGSMEASLIEHQVDAFAGTCPDVLGKVVEGQCGDGRVDRRQEQPEGLARRRPHEGVDIQPFVAGLDRGDGPLADRRPDPAADRLQAEPVLVEGPDLVADMAVDALVAAQTLPQFFLKLAWATGSCWTCAGRGTWRE